MLIRIIMRVIINAKFCDCLTGMGSSLLDALEIGYAIKDARAELGLTQAQLADAAGISKRCLWSLELGQNPGVQLDKLLAVFKALGLDLQIVPSKGPRKVSGDEGAENVSISREKGGSFDALSILTGGRDGVA